MRSLPALRFALCALALTAVPLSAQSGSFGNTVVAYMGTAMPPILA